MRSMSKNSNELKEFDPADLVAECIDIMADFASKYKVSINYEKASSLGVVRVDYDEFIQSLTNILRNSIQSISESIANGNKSFGEIKVSLVYSEQWVEVFVSDNGVGIEKENLNKIFKNQFTTKSQSDGTGLGLNISRRFIRAFDGDIYLMHSEKDVGATMVIKLPFIKKVKVSA